MDDQWGTLAACAYTYSTYILLAILVITIIVIVIIKIINRRKIRQSRPKKPKDTTKNSTKTKIAPKRDEERYVNQYTKVVTFFKITLKPINLNFL